MYALLDADGLDRIASGETKFEVTVYSDDGETLEVIKFWSTQSNLEATVADELEENGYVQNDAFDFSDAPYISAPVSYAD